MLTEETLSDLRLHGVLRGLDEQRNSEEFQQLNFEDRFGLLIDREWEERESRKLTRQLQKAKFKYPKACRLGYSVMYFRVQRLLQELLVARADGSVERVLTRIAKANLLILDDWGMVPFNGDNRRDMLVIIEEREAVKATMIASQLPVAQWHDSIGEPLVADAILDRLVHTAHRIELKGESMRKNTSTT
ncbi:MAG: ATP-binding protein, partial [Myxococcota bacterium]